MAKKKHHSRETKLFFDGGIRDSIMAAGYIAICANSDDVLFSGNRTCGSGTSNLAEYQALIDGLAACIKHKIKVVHIFGDSQLITNQVAGVYKTRNQDLASKLKKVKELLEFFDDYSIRWIPREQNVIADGLVNMAFSKKFGKKRAAKCLKKLSGN